MSSETQLWLIVLVMANLVKTYEVFSWDLKDSRMWPLWSNRCCLFCSLNTLHATLVTQHVCAHSPHSRPALCDSMGCIPPAPLSMDCLCKNTGGGCHAFFQEIFPNPGSNPCLLHLLHCRQIRYHWATGEVLSYSRN